MFMYGIVLSMGDVTFLLLYNFDRNLNSHAVDGS